MQINHTSIGRKYGWDDTAEVDWDLLENNRAAHMRVLNNPDRFPDADLEGLREDVMAIDLFTDTYRNA